MTSGWPFRLFRAFGIEIEYMIVDRGSLGVRPVADELIRREWGAIVSEGERGDIAWTNELALHVIELKTNGPSATLEGLATSFQDNVERCNTILAEMGAMLLPTGMHPLMVPARDFRLWPHEYSTVYDAFNRIFDCRGHGWSNLQSCHLNLPFGDDAEFGRLHAALRILLPILPAIAASSPCVEGRPTGFHDTRVDVYRTNARRVPAVAGSIIPEEVFTPRDYESKILQRIYADLAPLDPDGVLRHEWVNARGCIARFDRGAIEIRLLDTQECPAADIAIAAVVTEAARDLVEQRRCPFDAQRSFATGRLATILDQTSRDGEGAILRDAGYLEAFGFPAADCRAGELWRHITDSSGATRTWPGAAPALEVILESGSLSTRILRALGPEPEEAHVREVYADVGRCLAAGTMFHA